MPQPSPLYQRHRVPGESISQAVWLYDRFLLSQRDVDELLAERGSPVSYETIQRWCQKVGQTFADGGRRRRPRPGDNWHIDEVPLKIKGRQPWLMAECLEGLAASPGVDGRPERAARALRLAGAASGLRATIGAAHPRNLREWLERKLEPVQHAIGKEATAAAWAEGQTMTLEQAVAYALQEPVRA